MNKRNRSRTTEETKEEDCPCAASDCSFGQDTNHTAMAVETIDTCAVTYLYRRTDPCENQENYEDQELSQNQHNNEVEEHHTEPFSIPDDGQPKNRLSDILKQPVVEDGPNDEDVEGQYLGQSSSTSISPDPVGYGDFGSHRVSSQFSFLQSRYCPACRLLMQNFHCEKSKQFWREIDNEGLELHQNCHIKFFEKFLERLKDTFPEEEGLNSTCTINLLKHLLKVDLKDKTAGVRLSDLVVIIELFGPIKSSQDNKCVLIHNLYEIIKKSLKNRDRDKRIKTSWFVGEMTRDVTENYLLAEKDKTYLVRISGTDGNNGGFVLSVKHEDHCHHLKIQGDPKRALAETQYHAHLTFAGQEFSSLPDVVEYITRNNEIVIEHGDDEDDEDQTCTTVMCLRVFQKSPLNGSMSGYEKTKRNVP